MDGQSDLETSAFGSERFRNRVVIGWAPVRKGRDRMLLEMGHGRAVL
ncbi:MAG: hypothetical protein JWO42_2829 [Chloroflexi bacterium]|nr:hypothetical protein [Chloroflexota bacterium]